MVELTFTIEYDIDEYEYIEVGYETSTDTMFFKQGLLSYIDDIDNLDLSEEFKSKLKEVDNLKQWCLDSIRVNNQINDLTIEFDYKDFTDRINDFGYKKEWDELVRIYGVDDLFENGHYTLREIERLYKDIGGN